MSVTASTHSCPTCGSPFPSHPAGPCDDQFHEQPHEPRPPSDHGLKLRHDRRYFVIDRTIAWSCVTLAFIAGVSTGFAVAAWLLVG